MVGYRALRLAIAEIVAKENGWVVYQDDWSFRVSESVLGPGSLDALRFVKYISNYPDDVAAAMELLKDSDFLSWGILNMKDGVRGAFCWINIPRQYSSVPRIFWGKADEHQEARAISEAWLTTRRNNR